MASSDAPADCPRYLGIFWSPTMIERDFEGPPVLKFPYEEVETLDGYDYENAYDFFIDLTDECYRVTSELHALIEECHRL